MFQAVVAEARKPDWYVELQVPDSLDGRFSVLATLTALLTVRLEDGGADAKAASVALTERFIEAMDAEHRQIGFGDPTLGKIVRKLVGRLAKRVEILRTTIEADRDWDSAATEMLEGPPTEQAGERIRTFWVHIRDMSDEQLILGRLQ